MTSSDTPETTDWNDLSEEQQAIFLEAIKRSGLDTEALMTPKPDVKPEG